VIHHKKIRRIPLCVSYVTVAQKANRDGWPMRRSSGLKDSLHLLSERLGHYRTHPPGLHL